MLPPSGQSTDVWKIPASSENGSLSGGRGHGDRSLPCSWTRTDPPPVWESTLKTHLQQHGKACTRRSLLCCLSLRNAGGARKAGAERAGRVNGHAGSDSRARCRPAKGSQGPSGRVFILNLAMAAHSRTPAWGIPRPEQPGGLQSMGLQRVGRDCVTHFTSYRVTNKTKTGLGAGGGGTLNLESSHMLTTTGGKENSPKCF